MSNFVKYWSLHSFPFQKSFEIILILKWANYELKLSLHFCLGLGIRRISKFAISLCQFYVPLFYKFVYRFKQSVYCTFRQSRNVDNTYFLAFASCARPLNFWTAFATKCLVLGVPNSDPCITSIHVWQTQRTYTYSALNTTKTTLTRSDFVKFD